VEPLTAIVLIASKHGVKALANALSGNRDVGDVAAELFAALTRSEARLDEHLLLIEKRLDEVLDQRYTVAIKSGLRTLVDIDQMAPTDVRNNEVNHAKRLFVEASNAARNDLQAALAERYLLLTHLLQSNMPAAERALLHLDLSAMEALFSAHEAYTLALRRLTEIELLAAIDPRRRQLKPAREKYEAAYSRVILAKQALIESAIFAEIIGQPPRPKSIDKPNPFGKPGVVVQSPLSLSPVFLSPSSSRLALRPYHLYGGYDHRVGVIVVDWKEKQFGGILRPRSGVTILSAEVIVGLKEPLRQSITLRLQLGRFRPIPLTPEYQLAAGKRSAEISFKPRQITKRDPESDNRLVLNISDDALLFESLQPVRVRGRLG
jgi:hypothetical protein